jgi:hypothetical protein
MWCAQKEGERFSSSSCPPFLFLLLLEKFQTVICTTATVVSLRAPLDYGLVLKE